MNETWRQVGLGASVITILVCLLAQIFWSIDAVVAFWFERYDKCAAHFCMALGARFVTREIQEFWKTLRAEECKRLDSWFWEI